MNLDEALAVKVCFGGVYPRVAQRDLLKAADVIIHRYATQALHRFQQQHPELSSVAFQPVIDVASGTLEVTAITDRHPREES